MYSIKLWSIFAICISLFAGSHATAKNLELKFQWKTIGFGKIPDQIEFIPENVIPTGIDFYEDRLFLSFPRIKHGVPASLAYINLTEVDLNRSKFKFRREFIYLRVVYVFCTFCEHKL